MRGSPRVADIKLRPRHALGARDRKGPLIISSHDLQTVGYICANVRRSGNNWARWPIGTVFFIYVPIEDGPPLCYQNFYYAITAEHVIRAPRQDPKRYREPLSLMLPGAPGHPTYDEEFDPRSYEFFPETDLAICSYELPDHADVVPLHLSRLRTPENLETGLNTYSVGLLAQHPGEEHPRPFPRFGHLSIPNTRIERFPDASVHLVESLSWGGESGSPVFVYYDQYTEPRYPDAYGEPVYGSPGGQPVRHTSATTWPPLIGMLHGHYQELQPLTLSETDEPIGMEVDVNAGAAIVIASEHILTCLDCERFVKERTSKLGRNNVRIVPDLLNAKPRME
jgi:hypothetical protein